MAKTRADYTTRLADDPNKIPQIPENERVLMRSAWLHAHEGHYLDDFNTPHPKFLDRIKRDWVVHGRIPYYELSEIRLAKDKVFTRPAVHLTVDNALQAVTQDLPGAPVENADQVYLRIRALFVAFEFLKMFNSEDTLKIGFRYEQKLREFYREHSNFHVLIRADSNIRRKVDLLTIEDPTMKYQTAFLEVLDKKHYLWDSAISAIEQDRLRGGGSHKRSLASHPSEASTTASTPPTKRQKQRQRTRERKQKVVLTSRQTLTERVKERNKRPSDRPPSSKGFGKGNGTSTPGQIPKVEMDALQTIKKTTKVKRACLFWNASSGCSRGDGCLFDHKCIQCGLDHRWSDHHKN
jgi:hypothetical protein